MKTKGVYRGMSPFYITQVLPNLPAGYISIRHKLQGPNVFNLIQLIIKINYFIFSSVIVQLVQLVFKQSVRLII